MSTTTDKIYVIIESTGTYDTYCQTPIGFTYTKAEASKQVNKIRKMHNIKHPLSVYEDDFEMYNYYRNTIEDVLYEFEDQYDEKYDEANSEIISKYRDIIKADKSQISERDIELKHLEEEYFNWKVQFFNECKNEHLQDIIKSLNMTWEEYWKRSDAFDIEQSKEFNDVYFEELSLLK